MNQRNQDALAISDGACNPRAIIGSMKRAIDELVSTGTVGTDDILRDPALKLMTHQLAYLQGIPTSEGMDDWLTWRKQCTYKMNVVEEVTALEPPDRRRVPRGVGATPSR